jgi:hypothetical protein
MIRFTLTCNDGHDFESWFQSGAAYEALRVKRMVACTHCGSTSIEKSLMAPAVTKKSTGATSADAGPLAAAQDTPMQALAELRRRIETTSEYVGLSFAAEARAMHDGDVPERSIYGEARLEDAKRLIEDGVPVAPLPFRPKRQTN